MPKVSKSSPQKVVEFAAAEDRSGDLEGYTVNFVSMRETFDLGPALSMLPEGHCTCPHWGYVFKGRLTFRFDGREEVYEAGDAYYTPPGHAPVAEVGTEFVMFSPTDQLAATYAAIERAMRDREAANAG